jgi:hypothetical protein
MIKIAQRYLLLLLVIVVFAYCKKAYNPPAIQAANNYLVVDGFINLNPNETSTIILSRSKNLVDTVVSIPELNAQVTIQDNAGATYNLIDTFGKGNYSSAKLNLSLSNQYRLKIITTNGHQYLSDLVAAKKAPLIDSLTWVQDRDVSIFLHAHDATNSTVYYKWDYVETWEHLAPVQTFWVQSNGLISSADNTNQTDSCWTTANSNTILTGNSSALSQDVISYAPITKIIKDNERIQVRYSISVRQLPLTQDAYNYWVIIQKNSQQLGTLFDLQPSQLTGNIHPLTDVNEPVIGYITAATTQQKRLFIDHHEVTDWSTLVDHRECDVIMIPTNPSNPFIYTYPDPDYAPWYFTGSFPLSLLVTRKVCIDCREYGGVNKRPSFWQ